MGRLMVNELVDTSIISRLCSHALVNSLVEFTLVFAKTNQPRDEFQDPRSEKLPWEQ